MAGELPAAQIVIVESGKIVMNQRIGVNEFERARRGNRGVRLLREYAGRFKAKNRTNPLAACEHCVSHGAVYRTRRSAFGREERLQSRVYSCAILFKPVGKSHGFANEECGSKTEMEQRRLG